MAEARLQEKLASGAYYDYEQLVKTMFFKHKMKKKEAEYKALMRKAMEDLQRYEQKDLIVDILEIYYVEHVKKSKDKCAVDQYFFDLCKYAFAHGDQDKASKIIAVIVEFVKDDVQTAELTQMIAKGYEDKQLHTRAYFYYLKNLDEVALIRCMQQVMRHGYDGEKDLFVARLVLELLARDKDHYCKKAQRVLNEFKG